MPGTGIRFLLMEIGIWLVALPGGDGSDGAADRSTSNNVARDAVYMLKNFHSDPGDVEYSSSVDRDGYLQTLAVLTVGMLVMAFGMPAIGLGIEPHQTTWREMYFT
jgi:hypothetical protein